VLTDQGDDARSTTPPPASEQDGTYPRPQLVRSRWTDLSGPWGFAHDDDDRGMAGGWHRLEHLERTITVPFPPESPASGIADTGFHPVVWYSRLLTRAELEQAGHARGDSRLLVHFGAVDYRARVWLNGVLLGEHEGGHTPFSFDATDAVDTASDTQLLVVRAEDDPGDVTQPRGKQDWQRDPHVIWYHRTTGIWQTVWIEAVPLVSVGSLRWSSDVPEATVRLGVDVRGPERAGVRLRVSLACAGVPLGDVEVPVTSRHVDAVVGLPGQRNGQAYEDLLWSPEHPTLVDATVTLVDGHGDGRVVDVVTSYLGLRSAAVADGAFVLNDRPYFVRSVLEQGYWPESHLAAPSVEALRREVELIKGLGFNAARVHQKIEDPRFLWWADKLGLLLWGEIAGAFAFSPIAVARLTREWIEALERDVSHPCIVTWVPVNESWGVQHIAHDPAQQAFARSLAELTRALDPTRPVISNDGWEHVSSDILTVHDYEAVPEVVQERYGSVEARARLLEGFGPAGRRLLVGGAADHGAPVMLSEFGGIRFDAGAGQPDGWGYSVAATAEDFSAQLAALFAAVHASPFLAGFCYTQLTDTLQEVNGLLDEHRRPKVALDVIRDIVRGAPAGPSDV